MPRTDLPRGLVNCPCPDHCLCAALAPGAPQYNSSYFCEPTMTQCYLAMNATADFDGARAACQALGGASDIVSYSTGDTLPRSTQLRTQCDWLLVSIRALELLAWRVACQADATLGRCNTASAAPNVHRQRPFLTTSTADLLPALLCPLPSSLLQAPSS